MGDLNREPKEVKAEKKHSLWTPFSTDHGKRSYQFFQQKMNSTSLIITLYILKEFKY